MEKEIKRFKSHHNSTAMIGKYIPPKRISEEDFLKKLDEKPKDVPRAIYVHTPYCDKICSFCNMNREQLNGSLDSYAEYIAQEFEKYGKYRYFKDKAVDVIYFGGGTPSVYKPHQLELILKSIRENIILSSDYEFTFETTLHNLIPEKLEIMEKYGVNRFSIGIQSFNNEGRKFYNRTYDRDEVIRRIQWIKNNFKGEVCVDIIYNYPGQTLEDVREDARTVKELDLGSSSFYSLMVHDGSALSQDIKENKVQLKDETAWDRELHDAFVHELTKDGDYYLLELTKIAKKGRDNYQYIKTRNQGGDTFPIGVGAGGSVDNITLFRMNKEMSGYMEKSPPQMRIDRIGGAFQFPQISKKIAVNFLTVEERTIFMDKVQELKERKLLSEDENNYNLTEEGIFWGNNIAREVVTEILDKTLGKEKN